MNIRYKKTAIDDLKSTCDYIRQQLHNKAAAEKLAALVLRSISLLAENPELGSLLRSKYDVAGDTRFLVVSKQLVFYEIEGAELCILRILDGRQDYLSLLF
ncbi:MAG: type II toxin-antitoxin system RelE/ParE family toxin [Pseudoflavonifractor sp.]